MKKVLIVENDKIQYQAIESMLNRRVNQVEIVGIAMDGKEALKLYKELNPDILIIDTDIPIIDGFKISESIKKSNPHISIIMISFYSKFSYVQEALRIDVDDYILKPIVPSMLIESIDNVINKRKYYKKLSDNIVNDNNFKSNYINGDLALAKENLYIMLDENTLDSQRLRESRQYILETVNETVKNYNLEIDDEFNELYDKLDRSVSREDLIRNLHNITKKIFISCLKDSNCKSEMELSLLYIELYLDQQIRLNHIAEYIHISPTYYSKLFKKKIGMNFIEYLTERRIEMAKLLLKHTNLSISNISGKTGFTESNYFSRVFKENMDITPSEYRNNVINNQKSAYKCNKKTNKYKEVSE